MSYTSQFQTMQPDYIDEEISLYPEKSLGFSVRKRQSSYNLIGNRKCAFNLSNFHEAGFSFDLKNLTETEKNVFLDIYADQYKANGKGKTLVYNHPIYNEKFVCKFESILGDSYNRTQRFSYSKIELSIIGTDRNLIQTSSWVAGNSTATGFDPIGGSLSYDSILDYDDILDYDSIL